MKRRETIMRTAYKSGRRGGHAGGHLREPFVEWAETGEFPAEVTHNGRPLDIESLTGLLWCCSDVMPSGTCAALDMPAGSTYAQGARKVRGQLSR